MRPRSVAAPCAIPFCLLVFGIALLVAVPGRAQSLRPLQIKATAFGTASTADNLPFWLSTNEYGLVDRNAGNAGTRLTVERPFTKNRGFDYALGADVVARASRHSTLHPHQLYGQMQYGSFRLTAGWMRRTSGLVDSTLSMGSMMTSRNAPPIPRISVSTPRFVGVPGTHGFVSFKGYLAHGWLDDDRVVEDSYLHSKYLYLRVFPDRFPVQLHGGVVHNATWAGTHPEFGDFPDDLDAFRKVFFAQPSDDPDAEPSAGGEALGSANGMYDYAITARAWGVDAQVYREFYIETSAGADYRNVWDGLWGVSLDWADGPQLVERVLWEHLYTKRQSAQMENPDSPSFGEFGTDVYYSNGVYRSGWVYRGRTLGMPLMFADGENPGVDNNIVVAHHLGLQGTLADVSYRLFGTWSRNYGSRRVCVQPDCLGSGGTESQVYEPPLHQWSFLAEVTGSLSTELGLSYEAALSLDSGELYDERFGVRLGLSWSGRTSIR